MLSEIVMVHEPVKLELSSFLRVTLRVNEKLTEGVEVELVTVIVFTYVVSVSWVVACVIPEEAALKV